MLCHASFPWSEDEIAAFTSFFDNASFHRLPSRVEIEVLNSHYRRRLPSPDRPTPTLHCYKRIISTLTTFPTTLSRLYFASSLTRAPHHWSSIRHCRSLSSRLTHIASPHNDTHDDKLAKPLSLTEQLIGT
jgi:hypothetical protein